MTTVAAIMNPSLSICREIDKMEGSICVGFEINERHDKPSFLLFSCAEIC
jgi:hypothetical protein